MELRRICLPSRIKLPQKAQKLMAIVMPKNPLTKINNQNTYDEDENGSGAYYGK